MQEKSLKIKLYSILILTIGLFVGGALLIGIGYFWGRMSATKKFQTFWTQQQIKGESTEKKQDLLKYSFDSLSQRQTDISQIQIGRTLEEDSVYAAKMFYFTSEGRRISGRPTFPKSALNQTQSDENQLPVVVLLRGFVPAEGYQTGTGSRNISINLAKSGYITFAPDFLGFGESDAPPPQALAERFVKPLNIMDLIGSLEAQENSHLKIDKEWLSLDQNRLGLWGHSNGGQIAISVLEIYERPLPTVLWAPVTKSFPYSVLFFSDDYEDKGKGVRAMISQFERNYNVDDFSIGYRLNQITSKLQLHQGGKDDAVPQSWSDDFYSHFVGTGKADQIEYYVYEDADHNLSPNNDAVTGRTIAFFNREVKFRPLPTPTPIPTLSPESTQNSDLSTLTPTP